MNILFIKHFFVGFIVSEIPRVSLLGYLPLRIVMLYYVIGYNTTYYNIYCST